VGIEMIDNKAQLTVYYDGACPRCIKDRNNYQKLQGKKTDTVCWFDITGKDKQLEELGIDPQQALTELHVKNADGKIVSEMDAYILLMSRVSLLKPLAFIIALPIIRPLLARLYHYKVNKRLIETGRLNKK
jgi:predicted DCC family thiol-disulfide oxidoreductase YuxK